jgi:RNA polymerase sigma factor (sigma-70 family)
LKWLAVDDSEMQPVPKSSARRNEEAGSVTARQKWTLTREALAALLASLDVDSDIAAEKYLLLRRNLVRFFEGRGCRFAEDHADEAINRVTRRICEGEEVRDLNGYCYGVARLLLLEVYKESQREVKALAELTPHRGSDDDETDNEERAHRLECLSRCLMKLSADSRELILQYYQGERRARIDNRKRMCETLGIPNQALRSRAVRLRDKLENCVLDCTRRGGPGDTNSSRLPLNR